MTKEELKLLKDELAKMSDEEKKTHLNYLQMVAKGQIPGDVTGYASIDKPWLKYYGDLDFELPEKMSIFDFMAYSNSKRLDGIAINYFGSLLTYGELFQKVNEYAMKFSTLGVKCGDIVSICMPTTPETAMIFYALNRLGAVCDMIDPRSNPEQLDYYLKENKSKMLIVCENYFGVMRDMINEHVTNGNLENVIRLPITPMAPLKIKLLVDYKVNKKNRGVKNTPKTMKWSDFLKLPNNYDFLTKLNPTDEALIVHSSGTTSIPKGIVLTNRNVNGIALQYKKTTLKTDPGSKFLSVIPAFASFGMITSINLPFYLQMENILMPMVNADLFVKAFKKNKINFCLTVPGNFLALSRSKGKYDLTGLYGPGAGGYSLDSKHEEEINEYLLSHGSPTPMLMGWGMSELSSTACLETPENAKLLSSGVPLPLNTIAIFNPDTDEELPYNTEGEICVSGPTVMDRYLNNPEKTAKVKKIHSDGTLWLHSGDIGYMDPDGRVYHVDRKERMIIKGIDGFKIFPQKIEDVITQSPYVESCVVIGHNTDEKGIIPKAYIVLKKDCPLDNKRIIMAIEKLCRDKLSERAVPEVFEVIESLPLTAMGKIDYKKLEEEDKAKVKVKSLS